MAGRELDGAEAAQSDLFVGKSWIITPLKETKGEAIALVKELIEKLGARVIAMSPEDHDLAVAAISHLPQVISSLLAAQLVGKSPEHLALAGTGVLDTTRIAGSNPELWREILDLNREALLPLLKDFQKDLSTLIEDYDVAEILERGRKGRQSLPGKHRSASRDYTYLPVVIEDKPNQLALLFNECAKANVNVEDITIEHSPEQETGLVLLALSSEGAKILNQHLIAAGWRVHPPRSEK
jgi:prephenate dehydrogenase